MRIQLSVVYGLFEDLRMHATILKIVTNMKYIVFNKFGEIKGIDEAFYDLIFAKKNTSVIKRKGVLTIRE